MQFMKAKGIINANGATNRFFGQKIWIAIIMLFIKVLRNTSVIFVTKTFLGIKTWTFIKMLSIKNPRIQQKYLRILLMMQFMRKSAGMEINWIKRHPQYFTKKDPKLFRKILTFSGQLGIHILKILPPLSLESKMSIVIHVKNHFHL